MKRFTTWTLTIVLALVASLAIAGIQDRFSLIDLGASPKPAAVILPDITAPTTNPETNKNWVYTVDGVLYFEDDTGNVSPLISKTVELTNAQIKAMRATPVDLVDAPGAGKFLELVGAVLVLDYGSNVLTESADNMVIQYGSGTDATAAIEATGFIDDSADSISVVVPAAIVGIAASSIANDELELFNTGDGEYGGNAGADTTMTVKITYRVHTLGL